MEITLGDLIGYLISFVLGFFTAKVVYKKKTVVTQKKNYAGRDIVGRDKHETK